MGDGGRTSTLRTQFVLIVIGAAVVPLGLVALWLASMGMREGEKLLYEHLDQSADQFVAALENRWNYRQGFLLLLANNAVTTGAVLSGDVSTEDAAFLDEAMSQVPRTIPAAELTDTSGRLLWRSSAALTAMSSRGDLAGTAQSGDRPASDYSLPDAVPGETFVVSYAVLDSANTPIGVLRAALTVSGMIPADSARPLIPGAQLGVLHSATDQLVVELHRDVPFTRDSRVDIGSETWLAINRTLDEAGLEIVLAAPLAPYVGPFRDAGRVGFIAVIVVACTALALTVLLTSRVTRPLRDLAHAADAVSQGELDRQVVAGGPIEVRRVGRAFNVMADSLRATLNELSERNAMAAVGEFATALSHDVRNALTSIKVDVERTLHRPMDEAVGSAVLQRVLNNVTRLDSLVTGALRVARGKHLALIDIDVRRPVRAASEVVAGAFAAVPATLAIELPDEPLVASGDASALEQLLANVLFNAAQAVRPGGHVSIRARRDNGTVLIEIADDGIGMDEQQMARIQQPFYSTKSGGTGLGLPIARQIAAAHRGELQVASRQGHGTTVQLRVPSATTLDCN